MSGRWGDRTHDPLIKSPPHKNANNSNNKDLGQPKITAYKPAYKQNQKTAQKESDPLSSDLTQIVEVWPELPEHIKAAIKAIIETATNSQ